MIMGVPRGRVWLCGASLSAKGGVDRLLDNRLCSVKCVTRRAGPRETGAIGRTYEAAWVARNAKGTP